MFEDILNFVFDCFKVYIDNDIVIYFMVMFLTIFLFKVIYWLITTFIKL